MKLKLVSILNQIEINNVYSKIEELIEVFQDCKIFYIKLGPRFINHIVSHVHKIVSKKQILLTILKIFD